MTRKITAEQCWPKRDRQWALNLEAGGTLTVIALWRNLSELLGLLGIRLAVMKTGFVFVAVGDVLLPERGDPSFDPGRAAGVMGGHLIQLLLQLRLQLGLNDSGRGLACRVHGAQDGVAVRKMPELFSGILRICRKGQKLLLNPLFACLSTRNKHSSSSFWGSLLSGSGLLIASRGCRGRKAVGDRSDSKFVLGSDGISRLHVGQPQ